MKAYSKNCCNKHSTGSREVSRDRQNFKTCFFRLRFQKNSFMLYEPIATPDDSSSSTVCICVTPRIGDHPMVTYLSGITSPLLPFTTKAFTIMIKSQP